MSIVRHFLPPEYFLIKERRPGFDFVVGLSSHVAEWTHNERRYVRTIRIGRKRGVVESMTRLLASILAEVEVEDEAFEANRSKAV